MGMYCTCTEQLREITPWDVCLGISQETLYSKSSRSSEDVQGIQLNLVREKNEGG